MNIFENASISKLRFSSKKGLLATEDLWRLPLQSNSLVSLDGLAKQVNAEIKAQEEESFVSKPTEANTVNTLRLDILKHIIEYRLDLAESNKAAKAKESEKAKLLAALDQIENKELLNSSAEDIKKRLAELG